MDLNDSAMIAFAFEGIKAGPVGGEIGAIEEVDRDFGAGRIGAEDGVAFGRTGA